MSKNLKNGIIIKRNLEGGRFIQTSTLIIRDKNLTDSALRLLQLLGDAMEGTRISLTYYRKLLGWSKDKLSNARKNLTENGYLKVVKKPKGEENGFSYFYTISEYGNLVVEKDENGKLVELPFTSHSKKNKSKAKEDSGLECKMDDYLSSVFKILENIPPDILEVELQNIVKLRDKDSDVKRFETDISALVNKFKKECYKHIIAHTKNLNGEVARIQNAYKDWLKKEIFVKNNFEPKHETKWTHIKLQKKPRKTDYETSLLRD